MCVCAGCGEPLVLMFHRQKPVPQTPGIDRIDPSLLNARYPPDFVPFSNQPPNDSLFSRRVSRQRHPGRASLLLSRHMSLCHEENGKKKNFADATCKFVRYRVPRLNVQTHRKYATSNRLNDAGDETCSQDETNKLNFSSRRVADNLCYTVSWNWWRVSV